MKNTYLLTVEPFLDTCSENYRNIISINLPPQGPLGKYVVQVRRRRLSHFQCNEGGRCLLALLSFDRFNLMRPDQMGDLTSFLLTNGYTIDTSLTNMMNESPVKMNNKTILFFITYTKN
uniref:Uncharacterized protein n=1 Tax=viral metagenome TaxID=1070528 RepID=A0A6C0BB69_9ZZZZ